MKHLVLLVTLFILTAPVRAGGEHSHDHGHSHAAIEVPATLPEIRAEIANQQKQMSEAFAARDAATAHAACDVLNACVRALPAAATSLDEAARQRVTGMANNAAKAWSNAVHLAEDGDFTKAAAEAAKADAAYKLLEARLPKI
jgi:hypothetical protein